MGLSAIAVVVRPDSDTVWGPAGLLLDALTMCLVVIGRHVDQLRFLDVMPFDRPPMAPEENFYLRMLAGHSDGGRQAELFLQDQGLPEYFDQVAIKALALAARRQSGRTE
jgi:hypothetical protein